MKSRTVRFSVIVENCYCVISRLGLVRGRRCGELSHDSLSRLRRVKHVCRSIRSVRGVIAAVVGVQAAAAAATDDLRDFVSAGLKSLKAGWEEAKKTFGEEQGK